MKRLFALLLALLLLCGCAAEPAGTEAASDTAAAQTTEPAPLAGLAKLTEGSVLFYRQADFDARQGTLIPLAEVKAAPEEALLPRTHYYDERFPGDGALLLRLLDYALGNGYQGFSVVSGTIPVPEGEQCRILGFIYRIDYGKVLALDRDGAVTVWYQCSKADTMEKFSLGLAAAREIAADAPRGDDWETAIWIMNALADRITYGDRDSYYFKRGHILFDALVDGDTVCSGYSAGMYYLCSLCGLECLEVNGMANSLEKAGGLDDHVWDYVKICGNWYCFDPTWYDCRSEGQSGGRPLICCGLSEEVLHVTGGHRRTGEYADETMLPSCETCFDPAAAWNGSPEGALRSWLFYTSLAAADPSYLLLYAGLMTPETAFTVSDDKTQAVTDIPYAAYEAWADRFLGGDALGLGLYSETEDGKLLLRHSGAGSDIDLQSLSIRSVSADADGIYTADLGAAAAVFTVSQSADGAYRIETISLTPKE